MASVLPKAAVPLGHGEETYIGRQTKPQERACLDRLKKKGVSL
ncbi:hypothetical protein [Phocaeicola acetigenes]|uniref:Uncharacterized protein n=1 Tax=Phocaeicola acetigenes TaxID=3016083 RepID=A0ABT4PKW3_9BACT|nr:hypothetical protein [Phocaeicola sp. KGMB11183]MCZ8373713.1 hypothetical protein [Phocaeicola sp. KGMB11183]